MGRSYIPTSKHPYLCKSYPGTAVCAHEGCKPEKSEVMTDFPVSELRLVALVFYGSAHFTYHMMHESKVEEFLDACKELHFEPRKQNASLIKELHVGPLKFGNYWWCNPGLGSGYPDGPQVATPSVLSLTRVWIHPEALKEEDRAIAEEEAISARFDS